MTKKTFFWTRKSLFGNKPPITTMFKVMRIKRRGSKLMDVAVIKRAFQVPWYDLRWRMGLGPKYIGVIKFFRIFPKRVFAR